MGPRVDEAVIRADASSGVRFESGNPARRILHENGRVTGVETANGFVACAQAVNAAGAWLGFDSTLPFAVPIRPARGTSWLSGDSRYRGMWSTYTNFMSSPDSTVVSYWEQRWSSPTSIALSRQPASRSS